MLLTKAKMTAAVVLIAAGIMAFGIGLVPRSGNVTAGTPTADEPRAHNIPAQPADPPADVVDITVVRDGWLLVLGTEIKEGDKVRDGDIIVAEVDGKRRQFRRLKVGDKVDDGQFIGQINDELARTELRNKEIKCHAADADRLASEKTRDEATTRLDVLRQILAKQPGAVSPEELRGAELNVIRFTQEEIVKRASVRLAELDIGAAERIVALHQIRAVRGEIATILVRPSSTVKAGDTVVRIRVDGRPGRVPATPKEPEERGRKGPERPGEQPDSAQPAKLPADTVNIPARVDGFLIALGAEVKPKDNVAEADVIVVNQRRFRRLQAGDKVEEGQVIGLLDDRLAHIELEATKAKLLVAEAELAAATRKTEEAETTYAMLLKNEGVVAQSEIRAAQTKVVLAKQEQNVGAARVKVAVTDVQKAEYLLSLCEIRAVRGEIKAVLVRPGSLLKAGDAVVQIRVGAK
jgi:multidrug resistance efflux pump